MESFIHQHKKNKDISNNNEYYCLKGHEDFIDDDNFPRCNAEDNKNICAKKITRVDGTIKYMIKTSEDRKLYNPQSIFDSRDKKFLDSIARNQNVFQEVNYTVFSFYVKFLKTKNLGYLNNAEREI